MRHVPIFATLLVGLTACTQFPELDPFEPEPGVPFPRLLPIEQLQVPPPRQDDPVDPDAIDARADALRDRARAVRPDVPAVPLEERAAALRARAKALAER